jgi:hypothetical protein
MLKKTSFLMGYFFLALPLMAYGFDCNRPDFGVYIQDLNKDGYFVKYKERGGISYYNYTGPCHMDMHPHEKNSLTFAFIHDQLYARIAIIPENKERSEDIRDRMEKNVSRHVGTQPYSIKQDGDWWVYQWFNEKDGLKYKVKIHSRTHVGKSACYYEPLRTKLKNLSQTDDPASLAD